MSTANRFLSKLSIAALVSVTLFAFGMPVEAQTTTAGNVKVTGLPDDWTHHHLVFSNPGTEQDAIHSGKYEHWQTIVTDPRYAIQQLKRHAAAQGRVADDVARSEEAAQARVAFRPQPLPIEDFNPDPSTSAANAKKTKITKDWSVSLGSGATAAATGSFTGTPSTTTTVKIVNGSTNTLTLTTATSSATGTVKADTFGSSIAGDTVTVGTVVYKFENTASTCTGTYNVCVWYGSSTANNAAASLEAAINNTPSQCPTSGITGTWGSTCYTVVTSADAPNPGASATISTSTVKVTNLTYTTLTLGDSAGTDFTLSGGSITQVASCSSKTIGTLIIDPNSTTQQAANLAGAITSCGSSFTTATIGVTATSSGASVTVTAAAVGSGGNSIGIPESLGNFAWNGTPEPTTLAGGATATVQPNAYPAKYGVSLTGASCSDYVIYPTGGVGGSGSATIIAYDELYSGSTGSGGCGTTGVPAVYWAYNTASGYSVTTSPILSLDGTQVAFIESNGTAASLVLIKWAAETGESVTAPLTLTNQGSASLYRSCTPTAAAPCMYTIAFGNGQDDSFSAPFCDYRGDAIYVGDDTGNLHQFTGVFGGTPVETPSSPWPVPLGSNKLASPVFDATWNAIFVGDLGGKLYCVTSTPGSCQTGQTSLGVDTGWYESSTTPVSGGQIADAPLVNSSANCVLVFINSSANDLVHEDTEQYFPSSGGESITVGSGATNDYLYAGTYDNLYYDSSNNTGNLYVIGNTSASSGAILYQIAVATGFFTGTVTAEVSGLTPSGALPWPSPVSEFCNNGANPCAVQAVSGCTVSHTSTTITCSSGGFTPADVGSLIYGTDITNGTTISSYTSSMSVKMSAVGSASTSAGTATIASGTDYVFFSLNRGATGGCTNTAGNGCILSYNITNPNAVAISASTAGLNVTTPGTNGCWATGGLSIDNSATTTGASQLYFVALNGATAGSSANGPTSSNCTVGGSPTIDAVQDSQSNP